MKRRKWKELIKLLRNRFLIQDSLKDRSYPENLLTQMKLQFLYRTITIYNK
jgi:hypothetical protein